MQTIRANPPYIPLSRPDYGTPLAPPAPRDDAQNGGTPDKVETQPLSSSNSRADQLAALTQNFGAPPTTPDKAVAYKADGKRGGASDTGSIEGILRKQGYSMKEIYSKDGSGKTLVDRFVKENKLKDSRSLKPGQSYRVPEPEIGASKKAGPADPNSLNSARPPLFASPEAPSSANPVPATKDVPRDNDPKPLSLPLTPEHPNLEAAAAL